MDILGKKLSTRSWEVISLWWDVCNGVISLISQSSVDPCGCLSCLLQKKKNPPWTCVTYSLLSPIRHTHTHIHTVLNIPREQWDGAVKWEGLVTLSGDVWDFSQVDGEPQGAASVWGEERGELRGWEKKRKDGEEQTRKARRFHEGERNEDKVGEKMVWEIQRTHWGSCCDWSFGPRSQKVDSTLIRLLSHLLHLHHWDTRSRTGEHSGQRVTANSSMCCVLSFLPG